MREVDLNSAENPEQALIKQMDSNTRLLTISSIQYASGLKMDLAPLGHHCRASETLFCVDAIQSLGAVPFDAQAIDADFVMADGHKWMLGPEGLALFYCKQEIQPQLKLNQFGWHMVEHQGDYDRTDWSPATNAQRFECGSPNMMGIHALSASLSLLLEVGLAEVDALIQTKVDYLLEQLQLIPGLSIHSPLERKSRSGIINFTINNVNHALLHKQLVQSNIICAYRGGGIRFSPHFYTPDSALRSAIETLKLLIPST
ncbi:MAG: hypothetical protein COB04_06590 [Gammaproteobacteria bacterium]|nr:MAG: hypothetical protein COB04_06590 [Gammaproteobacteria bacterium]